MLTRWHVGVLSMAGGMILTSWCTAAIAADHFTLSSSFKDGAMMEKKNAGQRADNPNCVGENVSPPLSWSAVPADTGSFALIMVDPEARGGLGVVQWVAYGIPSSVTGFAEGEVSKASDKYVGGKGTQGQSTYQGPCTPPGPPHHYVFTLIATDLDVKELPPGLTRDELFAKLAGKSKGATGLVGLWAKP